MANSAREPFIYLDTFSSAVTVSALLPDTKANEFKLHSIEWSGSITAGHTAAVYDELGGQLLFSPTCAVANTTVVKYFGGQRVRDLYIAQNGVGSGHLVIHAEKC